MSGVEHMTGEQYRVLDDLMTQELIDGCYLLAGRFFESGNLVLARRLVEVAKKLHYQRSPERVREMESRLGISSDDA